MHVFRISAFAALLLGSSVSAQSRIYDISGPQADAGFGTAVAFIGDVNGDGQAEFAVGSSFDDSSGPNNAGRVQVFAGHNGALLWEAFGDVGGDALGESVASAGDVNNDGIGDVIVGAPGPLAFGFSPGYARVYSGLDGSVLYTLTGAASGDYFGGSVSGAGDVDMDGYDDLIVGAPYNLFFTETNTGYAQVLSGFDGSLVRTLNGTSNQDRFGDSVSGVGDLNADGYDDVIVGAVWDDTAATDAGAARVYSGMDGSVLLSMTGDVAQDNFGVSVSGAGDVNMDGTLDVIVGAHELLDFGGNVPNLGFARVFSGVDASVLYDLDGLTTGDFFGVGVRGAGDLDADGYADFAVASGELNLSGREGLLRVYSGQTGSELFSFEGLNSSPESADAGSDIDEDGLPDFIRGAGDLQPEGNLVVNASRMLNMTSDLHEISLAAGGVQTISLDRGIDSANFNYWILGSVTGTDPGLPFLGGVLLPLNFDAYTNLTLTKPFSAPFTQFLSVLDANGQATAAFNIPAGLDPSLAGVTIYHAFVEAQNFGVVIGASNYGLPVTLQP